MVSVGLLSATLLLISGLPVVSGSDETDETSVYRYNICNGLSNQLIYHAASIADAANSEYTHVEIPDYYILNGVQTSKHFVLPNAQNAASFGYMFDQEYFLSVLKRDLGIQGRFVRFDENATDIPECRGMIGVNYQNSKEISSVMDAFRPSQHIQPIIEELLKRMPGKREEGVCLHHRDGQDWHDHCKRWSSTRDGVYRGNCLLNPNDQSVLEATQIRALDQPGRWIYYCGDHAIPQEFLEAVGQENETSTIHLAGVSSRQTILDQLSSEKTNTITHLLASHGNQTHTLFNLAEEVSYGRDFWALIDFFLCQTLDRFVGNSVSTFSAVQIAIRKGQGAYWYNSQSVPVSSMWQAFPIPIVYTYTEASAETGRQLLKASIHSVREHMRSNPIHILYHGNQDTSFRKWLESADVIIHNHEPSWAEEIEQMRLNGDKVSSHLFEHKGNYLGTWQRIDIPHFIESEYALLLDADTLIKKPFSMADFGNDMTYSIAMSSEQHAKSRKPSNAGVLLMNIPYLRKTYKSFLDHILEHVETGGKFDHPSPSDQGAYLSFYHDTVEFLSPKFNRKPYIPMGRQPNNPFIFHFHGPKPHQYLQHGLNQNYTEIFKPFCASAFERPKILCRALASFAEPSLSVDRTGYCCAAFEGDANMISACQEIMETLTKEGFCVDIGRFNAMFEKQQKRLASKKASNANISTLCAPIAKPIAAVTVEPAAKTTNQSNDQFSSAESPDPSFIFGSTSSSDWNHIYDETATLRGEWLRTNLILLLSISSMVLIARTKCPTRRRTFLLITIVLISLARMYSLVAV